MHTYTEHTCTHMHMHAYIHTQNTHAHTYTCIHTHIHRTHMHTHRHLTHETRRSKNNIGNAFKGLGKYDEALKWYTEALTTGIQYTIVVFLFSLVYSIN